MNQATNVNIVPSYGQRGDLHFSQYDVGRTATINLYAVNEAYTIPVGATVKIQATKPSGLGFDVACTFSGSVVTVVSTETMTAEAGRFPAELHIIDNSDVIGTANFMFVVEASPHPDGTVDGDAEEVVNEIKALVLESEGYALGTQDGVPVDSSSVYYHNNAKWLSDNAVLSDEVKQTLLQCFSNVAWINGNGQTYYDALSMALNRGAELLSISAVYTQSITVYDDDSLDVLKDDLVVTAHYDGGTSETVITYTLSGTLEVGTSTITVSYEGKTDTFTVTVTASPYTTLSYIEADGNSYIDINYTPDQNTKFVIDYESLKASGVSFQCPIGAVSDTGTAVEGKTSYFYIGSANNVTVGMAKDGNQKAINGLTVNSGDRKTYSLSVSDFSVDGISYGIPQESSSHALVSSVGFPYYVFARNHGNTLSRAMATGKLYELSIYSSGTLVKHFVPRKRNADNEYGLLETIGGTFYTNSGSGTITGA